MFERVDDGETEETPVARALRQIEEAHVSQFVDEVPADVLRSGNFERVSDDEEAESQTATRRGRKAAPSGDDPGCKKETNDHHRRQQECLEKEIDKQETV